MKPSKESGSRYSDGNVPNVNWNSYNGKLNVNWYNPGNANSNLRSRSEVSKKEIPHYWDFFNKYFIQPFAIFEISCKSDSSSMYFLRPIILSSWEILINRFRISIFILAEFKIGNLLVFISKEALIIKVVVSKQIFSIFK